MSVETLVLLFIGLALIQQLLRAMRQQNHRRPEPTEIPPPQTPPRTPPPQVTIPPLLDTSPDAPSGGMPASASAPVPHPGGTVSGVPALHRTMEQRNAVGLRTRRDLRRAIVLVALLGPCRASRPYRSGFDEPMP